QMIRLYIDQGLDKGRTFESHTDKLSLGRSPSNHVVLKDSHISALHGKIFRSDDGKIMYSDLKSTNGSIIARNGTRITVAPGAPEVLQDGDTLLLGDVRSPVEIACTVFTGVTGEEVEQTS